MARGSKRKPTVSARTAGDPSWGVRLFGLATVLAGVAWLPLQRAVLQHISTDVESSLALLGQGKAEAAIAQLTSARTLGNWVLGAKHASNHVDLDYALGRAFMETNRTQDAASEFERVVAAEPRHWAAQANLGSALFLLKNYSGALAAFQESITAVEYMGSAVRPPLESAEESPQAVLAELYLQKGVVLLELPPNRCAGATCAEFAAQALRQAQILSPDLQLATQLLARATTDLQSNAASSKEYIKALFDEYAPTFESSLVGELHYGAPHDLRTAVDAVLAARSPRSTTLRAALDVGCGTGLAGAAFRSLVSGALVGVDLSAQMAARAEARVGVYARVVVGDLDVEVPAAAAAQTAAAGHAFDLVLFADVLIYFGDLRGPLQHAAAALEPGGLLALTLERPTDAAALAGRDWKWKLEGSGRYSHNPRWVAEVAEAQGLRSVREVVMNQLRKEKGAPIQGTLFIFEKAET